MQTKYTVKVYLSKFEILMDMLDTNSYTEVEEFVWQKCQEGMHCVIIDNELGLQVYARAEDLIKEEV